MKKLNLPIFNLSFNPEDEESGVYTVSIVDNPAVGFGYQKFNKRKENFNVVSEDKQILSGVILVADTPIYRYNKEIGEHYVMFDKETIRTLMQKFFAKGNHYNSNFNHVEDQKINDVYFYESFMIDKERGINPPKGYEEVPDGSWFGTMKVEDKDTWNKIKEGDFTGFSVEGLFNYVNPDEAINDKYSDLIEIIEDIEELLDSL